MSEVKISFYLKEYRIHVHMDTLRAIGSPKRISFLIHEDYEGFAVIPYAKRDFKSHSVPDEVYSGSMSLEIMPVVNFPLELESRKLVSCFGQH